MNKKTKIFLCTASIVGIVGVSGIFAYLTDTDTASNKFTVGKVKIELQEPKWDSATDSDDNGIPDYAENVVPNAIIEKDPQVKNVGKNDAYVYLKVTVPAKKIITAQSDGTLANGGQATDTQLFTYTAQNVITAQENGTLENNGQAQATQLFTYTPNAKWTEITSQRKTNTKADSTDVESYTYVYYYNEKVAPQATTSTLFDTVKFANVIEGQVDSDSEQQLNIEAYAIQSDNLPDGTSIEDAYTIFANQNK